MIEGIDHVVLAVPDPDVAAGLLDETLGLRASDGGRHDRLGTFNRLVWLGDSYLELIGIFDPALAAQSWLGRPVIASLASGGGLVTWAVAIDDLDSHLRWTAADGALTGPVEGERRRPDGRTVRWRLAHPPVLSATSPFVIEHDSTAAEWTADERRARAVETHPVGGRVRLASLEVSTDAPAAAAGRLRSLLTTTAEPDGRRAVRISIGKHLVRLASLDVDRAAAVELVTDARIRRRTARIGDCEIRLRGMSPPTTASADAGP